MAKKVYLGDGLEFKTKTSAKDFFRNISDQYVDKQKVEDVAHHAALLALLENHHEAAIKKGAGVLHFYKDRSPDHGNTSCFYVMRIDGTFTDFSLPKAVDGVKGTIQEDFRDACHVAVETKINQLRQAHCGKPDPRCEVTQEPLDLQSCHVLHKEPTFGSLIAEFRRRQGWDVTVPADLFTYSQDNQSKTKFTNPAHDQAFLELHDELANVLMVKPEVSRIHWR